jgi:hypothetical protein
MDPSLTVYSSPPVYLPLSLIGFPVETSVMIATYEETVRNILRRPHAVRAIMMGGILWRIAIHYGPPALITQILAGPLDNLRGWLHRSMSPEGMGEKLSEDEIQVLLGVTTNFRSVWPPMDIWQDSNHWNGEWSLDNETWFQGRIGLLGRMDPQSFQKRSSWKANFGRRSPGSDDAHYVDGLESQAKWLCEAFVARWPALWEGREFRCM